MPPEVIKLLFVEPQRVAVLPSHAQLCIVQTNPAAAFAHSILFFFHFPIGLSSRSILGMYLFGGKFCKFVEDNGTERDCTCPEIISHHPKCECDRKHFNNILWATVTVFQVSLLTLIELHCRFICDPVRICF